MRARHFLISAVLFSLVTATPLAKQAAPAKGAASITEADLKEWLTYIASDALQGRATYSEGLGLAAGYISEHLGQWGVKPAGDAGTYLQVVRVVSVKTNTKASVTVTVNGESRAFKDGEGVTFPKQMGGKQTVTGDQIAFVGYGLQPPSAEQDDYRDGDPKGKIVVYLGTQGPANIPQGSFRILSARARAAREEGAIATIGPATAAPGTGRGATPPAATATPAPGAPATPGAGRGRGNAAVDNGDFTTVQRYDAPVTPQLTADDAFLEFLFSGSDVKYADLKAKLDKREPLPAFSLKGVKLTIDVDAEYQVVRTRLTHNVVGIVEGSDRKLKDTYVAFGAHYDHVGYRESGNAGDDLISNGADDDGSGTVAIMALAKAFASGPRPKRSLLFVWHAGEENGLLGSEYMADHPSVPLDKIVAQLNIDMIGRNRNDDPAAANMVLVVGSDRISTELHNINEEANAAQPTPLMLDYEMNDPADSQSIYTRSDHYSYASKGIPIIFYFTGLHPDYHRVSDSVDKIIFPKMTRITRLVYTTGFTVANRDKAPERDNQGPRMGKGSSGKLPIK
ncbi:MAG: M20/M25/M40 family metallo-hydrolase [Vicinamibacterales bacterium]